MIDIVQADLSSPEHARAIVELLSEYARDVMGGGNDLSDHAKTHVVGELHKREHSCVVLAFVDSVPAGMAICFEAFSTFACKAILNIHDFVVAPRFRGQGLSQAILAKVEEIALARNCCKLTLEVLEGNFVALHIYQKFGFASYELDPKMGRALFFEKKLS
jgi:GNAT superfamily N-acetyltransferase